MSEAYSFDGTNWDLIWRRSDPVTLTFYPDWSQGYMYSNGQPCVGSVVGVRNNDLLQGYWDISQGSPAGDWDHTQSVAHFGDLAAQLAIRPVIKSASLRLRLAVGYGGDPKNTNVMLGYLDSGGSPLGDWNHTDTNKNLQDTGDLFTANGQVKTIVLNAAMRNALQAGNLGIAFHDTTHSTSEAGKRATRAVFDGASAPSSDRPMLTVTLDYV